MLESCDVLESNKCCSGALPTAFVVISKHQQFCGLTTITQTIKMLRILTTCRYVQMSISFSNIMKIMFDTSMEYNKRTNKNIPSSHQFPP